MENNYSRLAESQSETQKIQPDFFVTSETMSNQSRRDANGIMLKPLNGSERSRTPSPSRPLIPSASANPSMNAPMANVETDEETDDRETVNKPYPGVDDGFFANGDANNTQNGKPPDNNDPGHTEVEFVNPEDVFPKFDIQPRIGPDGGSTNPDDVDGLKPAEVPQTNPPAQNPELPGNNGFRPWGFDWETGTNVTTLPSGEVVPDLNVYQHKKTLAQGMMDLALFSANANQLRYILETFRTHPYYYPSLVLISISLIMQVAVGTGLIWNATYNVKDKKALCIANKINNFTIIGVFLVTVINVFISAFGVAPAPTT